MDVVWGIVGIVALAGFAVIAVLLPFIFWREQQFLRILREYVNVENDTPSILTIKPRWRANIVFARYILSKKYEHEKSSRLKRLGGQIHTLHMLGYIFTIVAVALFALILLAAPH